MKDVGQLVTPTVFRAHTIDGGSEGDLTIHPQRRFPSKPLDRHVSHFHAAWFAN
jgi:hypothetical protein